jgi:hypothetical protein
VWGLPSIIVLAIIDLPSDRDNQFGTLFAQISNDVGVEPVALLVVLWTLSVLACCLWFIVELLLAKESMFKGQDGDDSYNKSIAAHCK